MEAGFVAGRCRLSWRPGQDAQSAAARPVQLVVAAALASRRVLSRPPSTPAPPAGGSDANGHVLYESVERAKIRCDEAEG